MIKIPKVDDSMISRICSLVIRAASGSVESGRAEDKIVLAGLRGLSQQPDASIPLDQYCIENAALQYSSDKKDRVKKTMKKGAEILTEMVQKADLLPDDKLGEALYNSDDYGF